MTANLLLRMTTTGDKSEIQWNLAGKRFESGNFLTANFGDLGIAKNSYDIIIQQRVDFHNIMYKYKKII